LFALAPATEGLFRGDMESQGQMLSHMMQFLVHAMSRPEFMALGLRDLGRRHDAYGVAPEYYPAFRQAFLESARGILGERHTPQVEKAWADTIDMIIEAMRKANSAEPAKYLPVLHKLSYMGATGRIEFDGKGDRKNAEMTIFTMKGGNLEPIAVVKSGKTIPYAEFIKGAGAAAKGKK